MMAKLKAIGIAVNVDDREDEDDEEDRYVEVAE
jgi:hypothetical protein